MQSQSDAEQQMREIVMIATVSKSGNRLCIGVPRRSEQDVQAFLGKPVRVTIEALI